MVKRVSNIGYALTKSANHGETDGLRTTNNMEDTAIKNPIRYAPPSPKNIRPLG